MSIKNNNEDDNYPRITLNTVVHNFRRDLSIYAYWNNYLSPNDFNMSEEQGKQ